MRVGIIDVGANTIRLLVADRKGNGLKVVHEERAYAGLGAEVERYGQITTEKLYEVYFHLRNLTALSRGLGCEALEVLLTSPGRQCANRRELLDAAAFACGGPAQVLSHTEEGLLAWAGAVPSVAGVNGSLAVCDVGGGSTELVIGSVDGGPEHCLSLDIGALRLSERCLRDDPPGKRAIEAARREVAEHLDGMDLPTPDRVLAVGGTARALRRMVGPVLGHEELDQALRHLAKRRRGSLAGKYGISARRSRSLPGGAAILAEVQQAIGVPLTVVKGGLREGAARNLLIAHARARD